MSRRSLWTLNLLFAAAAVWSIYALTVRWREAESRRAQILKAPSAAAAVKAAEAKAVEAPPPRAASYFEVAEKLLFSKDRNPAVVVEVEEKKPMPALPAAFGVMDLGQGPVAFLALKGASQRGYRAGETVGDFKLAAVTPKELTFEWEGQRVIRKVEELRAEQAAPADSTADRAASPAGALPAAVAAATRNVSPNTPPPTLAPGSGAQLFGSQSGSMYYCKPDDTTPAGAVVDGYKKTIAQTPIGKTCFWEPAK